MSEDPRLDAARYRVEKLQREMDAEAEGDAPAEPEAAPPEADQVRSSPGGSMATDRAAFVETSIQQAIRRGDFDDLPGAGKPLEGLGAQHDPDWWIRRKIQTEKLTGLGPPSLMLRTEHAEFSERADAFFREQEVRDYVADFNRRVIEARRQLQGGPPVVTPLHDVEEEVAAWHERRAARHAAASATAEPETPRQRRRRRWLRRSRP
ncbi:DUF1992 domain-containing protein [Microbacterium sp. zg.Y625]|uniref:DnaJ family domain-containing protein n=1 Tax=Microbacterium jiangjiandongii TaxID=3049071 RepID=UPI00214B0727|nr:MULTISPECIES: DUF1992 domain-containing protein [unclassified Microbacterium]MCR2792169.1 DUF1992 domain-containing protein [Microbacterium sp. zg.Y625]WIM24973.1 DUF1992 domain-containing protein [Microbacterium sp. zg-Y625]